MARTGRQQRMGSLILCLVFLVMVEMSEALLLYMK